MKIVLLRRSDSVDTGHAGDNNDVTAGEQRRRRGEPQAVNFFVNLDIFFDIGISGRDIGFRLVVVVVADEVMHRVIGKEISKLAVQLRRKSFVRGDDYRWTLHLGNYVRHSKGLS